MKPYNKVDEVTYEMITTHPYFRTLTQSELYHIIGSMDYEGYIQLPGSFCSGKAEALAKTFETVKGKLIGYRCPVNMFAGKVPKGTIFKKIDQISECIVYKCNLGASTLPSEIVETWEPVYEETLKEGDYVYIIAGGYGCAGSDFVSKLYDPKKVGTRYQDVSAPFAILESTLYKSVNPIAYRKATKEEIASHKKANEQIVLHKIGSGNIDIFIKSGTISAEGRTFTLSGLIGIRNTMIGGKGISDYVVSYPKVKIGCSEFNVDELNRIIQAAENQL